MDLLGRIINLTTYITMDKETNYITMDKETKESIRQLVQRMELVVALMLKLLPKKELSFKEQVRLLNDLKIRPVDISKMTGRSQGYVNKELTAIRKEK